VGTFQGAKRRKNGRKTEGEGDNSKKTDGELKMESIHTWGVLWGFPCVRSMGKSTQVSKIEV